jgi:uncharacterized repeat protein (TIGR03803 family)
MKRRSLRRDALALSIVVVLGTACGGSEPPTAAPGAAAQAARGHRSGGYESLYSFTGSPDGAQPTGGLIVDGQFYGTTQLGGDTRNCHDGCGTVFRISSDGQERVVYRFKGRRDGKYPQAGLTELSGELYGTTYYGGTGSCPGGCGVVFRVLLGREKVIYSFKGGADGAYPERVLFAINGTLYGTTSAGGSRNEGTFFAVSPSGQESVVHSFQGGQNDGAVPVGNMAAVSGALYGATEKGGYGGGGTIFHAQPSGGEELVHSFVPSKDGADPTGLVAFPDSDTMYGTATNGGSYGLGTLFYVLPDTAFSVIYNFQGHASGDGAYPEAAPIVASYGLYGTTRGGGTHGNGTVYEMNVYSEVESVLYSFGKVPDGVHPAAPLLDVYGTFYGTTMNGGSHGNAAGTVFSIEP